MASEKKQEKVKAGRNRILVNFGMKDRLFTDFAYFCEAEMKLQLSLCGG